MGKNKKKKDIDLYGYYVLGEKKFDDNEYSSQKQDKNENIKSNDNVKKEENTIEKEGVELKMVKVRRVKEKEDSLKEKINIYKEKDSTNKKKKLKKHDKEKLDNKQINNEKTSKDPFLIKSKNRKRIATQQYIEYLLSEEKIICLNEELYKYDDNKGYYKLLNEHEFGVLLYSYIMKEHKRFIVDYDIRAMYRLMKIQPKIQLSNDDIDNNDMLINCNNCVVNLNKNKLYSHSYRRVLFNCINANLIEPFDNKEFKNSVFNGFLNNITSGDKELKKLIQEIFGYSFSSINSAKKFFIFYGVPNSGKSTLIDILNYIVGEENCSHIPLQKLTDDKYCAELFGKLLNTYSELPDEGLKDLGKIKGLVSSNDKITARKLFNAPFSFKNKCTLIFACNNLPEINTKLYQDNSALFKRLIIVPFLNSIEEENQDKYLFEKLVEEKDLIFNWGLKGLTRLIDNNFIFSDCEISSEFLNKYMEEEDLISSFIDKRLAYKQGEYEFWDKIKEQFRIFAKENDKGFITAKELKFLKKCIEIKLRTTAKRIHRDNNNKLGFNNIKCI